MKPERVKRELEESTGKVQPDGTPLFTLEDVKNTPFKILVTDQGKTLVFGKYRLTDPLPEREDIYEYIETNKWNIIGTMCLIISEKLQTIDTNK